MRKVYDKLVRDRIIEIIEADGKVAEYEVVGKEECKELLAEKLQEEMKEFLESREVEELADMLEVIEAYARLCGVSWEELMEVKREKAEKRGGFERRLLLKWVEERKQR